MSTRFLKRFKRRLIPVLAIAAAVVPTSAQAQVLLDGAGSSAGAPSAIVRPDDRGTRGSIVDEIQQPAPVRVSAPSAGFSWSDASYGVLLGFVAAIAVAGMAIGLRRQKHGELAV